MIESSRPATPADVARIVELAHGQRDELAPLRGGGLWQLHEAWPPPLDVAYAALLGQEDASIVVGTIDGVALGFGAVVIEELRDGTRLGVITDLYVEAEAREVGLGDAIAADLLEFCRAAGCRGVDAVALPGHRATKNFFEAHGFSARSLTMHRDLGSDELP
jgi:ribosomal protein S18 acetylase RimI-like enzyme